MKIAVTSRTLSNRVDFVKWLNGYFDEVRLNNSSSLRDDSLVSFLDGCECVVLGTEPFHKGVIDKTDLKVVFKYGVGVDNIDFNACEGKGLPVCAKKGTNSDAVSEIALSYIIQLLRNQHISFSSAKKGNWDKQMGKELADAKIGILGYGNIGKAIEKKIKAVSPKSRVVFNDRNITYINLGNYEELDHMFNTCDAITIHIDNDDLSNKNFIDGRLLSLMKNGSCLINTARGSVVNYDSVRRHLDRLGGVAFDVYPNEPEIPLFLVNSDKAILSCHICGSSETGLKNGEEFVKKSILEYLK
jgi:phosphoglycerate dehydrogenase-like enzyme